VTFISEGTFFSISMTLCYLATPNRYVGYKTDQSVPNKENIERCLCLFFCTGVKLGISH